MPDRFRVLPSFGARRDRQLVALRWIVPVLLAVRRAAAEDGIRVVVRVEIVRDDLDL